MGFFDHTFEDRDMEEKMRVIRNLYRRMKRAKTWYGVHKYFKLVLQLWREHGEETFNDEEVGRLRADLRDRLMKMREFFVPYNEKYCTTCNGACCFPLWGAFSQTEVVVMDVPERTELHRSMEKKKDKIKALWQARQCMFLGSEVGCKLPEEMRSVICVSYICPVFNNIIPVEERQKVDRMFIDMIEVYNSLVDRVNEIRREKGLPTFDEKREAIRGDDENAEETA